MAHNFFMDNLENRATRIEEYMSYSSDLVRLDFELAHKGAVVFYIDAMIDKVAFERSIMEKIKAIDVLNIPYEKTLNNAITSSMPIFVMSIRKAMDNLASGDIVLIIEGSDDAYVFSLKSYTMRSPSEPPTGAVLHGPREGFVEDIKVNMTMIRRRLRTNHLVFANFSAGEYSNTAISICYIDGIADKSVVAEVEKKLRSIDTDALIDSSYVARYLESRKNCIFNQVGFTEKPDVLSAKLLEGRIGIIVDGSPMVLTVPLVLIEEFQSAEDYISKSYKATFVRCVRLLAFIVAILLPAFYVALQEFQYQIFPLKVLAALINTIFGVPLPPTLEMS